MSTPSTSSGVETSTKLLPFPNPQSNWAHDDPSHSGFLTHGIDFDHDTAGRKAILIHLEAKPGKEELVAEFFEDINNGVEKEPLTGPWFGNRFSKTTFIIFEAFPSPDGRHAHFNGPGGRNFLRSERLKEMLAYPANIYALDVLHGKFGTILGQPVTPVVPRTE